MNVTVMLTVYLDSVMEVFVHVVTMTIANLDTSAMPMYVNQ